MTDVRTRLPSPTDPSVHLAECGRWFAAMSIPSAVIDRRGVIQHTNSAWSAAFGVLDGSGLGDQLSAWVPTGPGDVVRLGDRSGRSRRHEVTISPVDAGAALVQLIDVEERCALIDHLTALTTTDALTGLLNRRGLFDRIDTHLARCRRSGADGGALLIDLDRLKSINDHHGHQVGDVVIAAVGGAIAEVMGPRDAAGRIGGDEFAVLIGAGAHDDLVRVAGAVQESVGAATDALARRLGAPVTVSIGAAVVRRAHRDAASLLDEADRAMYRCKHHRTGAA